MTRPDKKPGLSEVQTAIYGALSASMTVLYAVDENQAFPYATIGESSGIEDGTKTGHADESYETIHFWSRANGFKEVKDLISLAASKLIGKTFVVNGYKISFLEIDQIETMRDPDNITRHGVLRIKTRALQP